MRDILLVGKPNSGKSSLFNHLTGLSQKVGNYSGVTVSAKSGMLEGNKIIDIPGLQTLITDSPDEVISRDRILEASGQNQQIIFVANGNQLQDSLLLFSQIADLQIPSLLVINFSDEVRENNIDINIRGLQNTLGCPVLMLNSKKAEGVEGLKQRIANNDFAVPNAYCRSLYDAKDFSENTYNQLLLTKTDFSFWEQDFSKRKALVEAAIKQNIQSVQNNIRLEKSKRWDKVLLHPVWGIFIFLFTLFVVFQALFFISSYPMDWIDLGISSLGEFVAENVSTPWLQQLLCDAMIPGLGGVLIFIPQIAILFFLIGILEQIGYLSRISYLSDAFLRKFGLSGHSVIPLISGWACAIPAIMSARIIDNPRERLAVILASPLMTCSARLPVYTILISVLVPEDHAFFGLKGLLLLLLYIVGTVATLLVSMLTNKYLKVAASKNWMLELPVFRTPDWKTIFINVYQKTSSFVFQAGKIIFLISILLWVLASFSPKDQAFIDQEIASTNLSSETINLEYSYLGYAGKAIEPVIKPLGYDWKIGIALISSFAAREVFVGTLSSIYSIGSENDATIVERLKQEKTPEGAPVFTLATSLSLLIFYVFAMQCMSTLAIVRKETGEWKYAAAQFVFMTGLAFVCSFIVYQVLR